MNNWNAKEWLEQARVAQDISEPLKAVFKNTKDIVSNRKYTLYNDNTIQLPNKPHSHFINKGIPQQLTQPPTNSNTIILLTDDDCLKFADYLISKKAMNPAVMILGSIDQPGGGVIDGRIPQEEDIYRRTNIYEEMFKYSKRRSIKSHYKCQYPLNEDFGLVFIEDVCVFRGTREEGYKLLEKPFTTNFFSVSAPNNHSGNDLNNVMKTSITNKLRNSFNAALKYGCDSLVLGALGCDDYKNPPHQVASIFHQIITEYEGMFKVISICIPKDKICLGENVFDTFYNEFKDCLTDYLEDDEYTQKYTEGSIIDTHYGKYERSQMAKKKCLEHYGYICQVCKIDYEKKYGQEIGKSVIEVHHLDPIHGFHGKSHTVDPIEDLRPVCSNCHSILHSKSKDVPYTIAEVQKLINE